jgi:hypothetical protein
VVRHEDITEEKELMALPEFFEFGFEEDASRIGVEIGKTAVATEGDEAIAAFGLVSLLRARQEEIFNFEGFAYSSVGCGGRLLVCVHPDLFGRDA